MPVFTKYNKTTGKIVGTLYVPNVSDAQYNLQKEEDFVVGEFDAQKYFIKDGAAHLLPSEVVELNEVKGYWKSLRKMRDKMLSASDWTQVPDAPVDQAAWAVYRQELRDLPKNTVDPRYPVWPTPPQ